MTKDRGSGTVRWDFFISYTQADRRWAEWIAWQLELQGHKILVQSWDMVPGSNWIVTMENGIEHSDRTIAVLSNAYLKSVFGRQEWLAAYMRDPEGIQRKLVPVRIEQCDRPGVLKGIVSFDLFGVSESKAKDRLALQVQILQAGRGKPARPPNFPSQSRGGGGWNTPSPGWQQASTGLVQETDLFANWTFTTDLAFSADEKLLALCGDSRNIEMWELDAGRPPRRTGVIRHSAGFGNGHVRAVEFSPDGRWLATGGGRTVLVWEVFPSGEASRLAVLDGMAGSVTDVSFSPHRRLLAIARDQALIEVWDFDERRQPEVVAELLTDDLARTIAFSREGRWLVAGCADGTVALWDLTVRDRPITFQAHRGVVHAVAFSPKGWFFVTAGSDATAATWILPESGRPERAALLTDHRAGVLSVAFSRDGRLLATGSSDETASVWDFAGGPANPSRHATFTQNTGGVSAVAFSPDGRHLGICSLSRRTTLWRLAS